MLYRLVLFIVVLLIAGCGRSGYAPVVNGWKQPASRNSYYIVQKGDTVFSIARAFRLDYRQLARRNHLRHYAISPGQRLRMSGVSRYSWPKTRFKPKSQWRPKPKSKWRPRTQARSSWKPKPASKWKRSPQAKSKWKPRPRPAKRKYRAIIWVWPVKGKVVSRYSNKAGGNKGIDIIGHLGEAVRAAAPGQVVYSGSGLRGYGKLVIIKSNRQFISAYAYNKALLVKEGAIVRKGQKIATMGRSPRGRVCLHFEIRRNGRPVNPLTYLR